MNKKYNLWSFIAIVIAMLSFTTFTSCKDDEDIDENGWIKTYPNTENYHPFDIKDAEGELYYSNKEKKWYIHIKNSESVFNRNFGDESSPEVEICNSDEYIKNISGTVKVSGSMQFVYLKVPKESQLTASTYHYKLTITNIEAINNKMRKARSSHQEELICGTPSAPAPTWLYSRTENSVPSFAEYLIRVYIHIVRSSSGEGLSKDINNSLMSSLNSYFKGTNFSFYLSGSDYIDNDTYNLMSDDENVLSQNMKNLFAINTKSNAINIYVISDSRNLIRTAGASFLTKTGMYVRNDRYATSTVAHEMGHCLGLYHTHNGTGDNNGTPELVNGSNSSTAGDYITDTPADPNRWNGFGGYTGGDLTDANGDRYNPDPLNLMSYSGHYNRGKITIKQSEMMYKAIANTRALQMTCTTNTASISGPDIINSSATYSINVSDDYTVTWNIIVETFTSKTASTKTYMSATGKSFVLKNPNVNATSQKYTITANIKNKKGVTFQQNKIAYHVIPSAATGTFKWSSELSGYPSYNKMGFLDPGKGDSYNTVSVFQNGDLYFYYTDVCGVNTYNNSYFNFVLNDNYSNFTKYTGGYHAYKCSRNAGTGSYTAILQVMAGSYSKLIPLNMQILQHPNPNGYDEEPKDSLEILKAKKISKYIKRI